MQLENLNTKTREWLPSTGPSPVWRGGGEGAKHRRGGGEGAALETNIAANVAEFLEASGW